MKKFFLILVLSSIYSCKKEVNHSLIPPQGIQDTLVKKSTIDLKNWQHKDIELDTIPGISLQRAYDSLLVGKKGKEVIVAVIDTKLDIHHLDIKQQLWINANEIPNNNIDDDNNGYVDDIHGWNFLGNVKYKDLLYQKYACLRVVQKYENFFKEKQIEDLNTKDSLLFVQYKNAEKELAQRRKGKSADLAYADMLLNSMAEVKKELLVYFPNKKYTLSDLDSLKKEHPKNKKLQNYILRRSNFMKYGLTQEYMDMNKLSTMAMYEKMLNATYNERAIQGDDSNDLNDAFYGNNRLFGNVPFKHSIGVTGLIAATRNNNEGINGISNNIKIMPVIMVASGDEHDKDIALAIRYAVDNGAKIINMSWRKNYSLHTNWVQDAMKYAAEKDVILVSASGNDGQDNDLKKSYPDDNYKGKEFLNNFISVGASGFTVNKKLKPSFSNYGKENVDIYAPGTNLYTTATDDTYEFGDGTSYASPIVAGVAALIRSYYPKLTASQVKHILMDSGIEYTIEVNTPTKEDKNKTTPFNQLSKSGKVVNAYNALIMADRISNQ